MCYRLAMEMPDRISAAGVVAGSVGIRSVNGKPVTLEIPKPSGPISLIHICGQMDSSVPFKGGQSPKNKWLSVPDDIQLFVAGDGCSSSPIKQDDKRKGVHKTLYSGCRAGTEVELVILDKCGHEWPEERHGLYATRALWGFFAAHPRIKESR
jgi:polyhydroxybutyrate depolymerase